jgi:type IV pilus assembly protein PilW
MSRQPPHLPPGPYARGPRRRTAGFTLVELMVAMTVGLVLALAISLAMLSMGRQFRIVGATTAAQVNAQLALAAVDEAGRAAGAGLYSNGQPLCQAFNSWYSGAVRSDGAPLMPARIIDGGNAGTPDRIVFTSSNATGPLSGLPVLVSMATAADSIVVPDAATLAANDIALVGVPGSAAVPCTLFQVTAAPTSGNVCDGNAPQCKTVPRASGGGNNFNAPPGTFATEPRYGFQVNGGPAPPVGVSAPAVVMRLGTEFRQDAFGVLCETLVQYNAFTSNPACTTGPLAFSGGANALVSDVVLMHAQYGVSVGAASDIVTNWVDASGGTWLAPSAANAGRIKAVRVVVVTRSKEAASEQVTPASCTNGGGVVNTGPCSFDDAEAPPIDLSGLAVPGGRTWRHYRYRVHQAVIPLRNVIWSDG